MAASAQAPATDPSSQQIIDALKPSRSRSMRNLGVREAQPEPSANTPATNASPTFAAPPGAAPPAVTYDAAPPAADAQARPGTIDLAIQFEFNSSRVSSASRQTLEQLSLALASPELAGMKFRIEGHTDSKGSAAYNRRLSEARANEVRRILIEQQIAPAKLRAVGRGSSQPLNVFNPTAAENRRVRIVSLEQ